jgi:hypothetical protein
MQLDSELRAHARTVKSLEHCADDRRDRLRRRQLVTIKMLGTDGYDVTVDLGNRPYPRAKWKFANLAFHEFDVWQAHVPGIFEHAVIFDDDQERLSVGKLYWFRIIHAKNDQSPTNRTAKSGVVFSWPLRKRDEACPPRAASTRRRNQEKSSMSARGCCA